MRHEAPQSKTTKMNKQEKITAVLGMNQSTTILEGYDHAIIGYDVRHSQVIYSFPRMLQLIQRNYPNDLNPTEFLSKDDAMYRFYADFYCNSDIDETEPIFLNETEELEAFYKF